MARLSSKQLQDPLNITGSLFGTSSYALTASYAMNGGGTNIDTSAFVTTSSFNSYTGSVALNYVLNSSTSSFITNSQTSSFVQSNQTSSFVTNNQTSSFVQNSQTSSFVTNSQTSSFVQSNQTSSFATTGSNIFKGNQTITGSIIFNSGSRITSTYYGNNYPGYIDIVAGAPGGFVELLSYNQSSSFVVEDYGVYITTNSSSLFNLWEFRNDGRLLAPRGIEAPSFTGSLQGTASFATSASRAISSSFALSSSNATNAATASNILGGKATHIPFFKTDTTLATSSLYQSGSSTVIINQDNATSANPEALYVWQPSTTSFNVISGKGNLNNYLQLNIQNTNQGTNASSDVVATAGNGNETTNYIDMGINSDNFIGDIGGPNDAYLYSTGQNLHIGNATANQPVQFFAGGIDVEANKKLELNANGQHNMTGSLDISGSLNVRNTLTSSGLLTNGNNNILGNITMSGSSTIIGTTTMTGSLNITGSTIQIGNNTLVGNTILSGSIIISGSTTTPPTPSIKIYGDMETNGVIKFMPVNKSIDTSISASYIYISGSTNDLYFSQNGNGYANTTRLRWLEGNLYTGLLNGGLITSQSSTVYQVGSGSGVIVNLNASLTTNPFPTIQYLNWPNLSASIAPYSASFDQQFVSVQSNGTIFAQGTPFSDGQFNTLIPIGLVLHQNHSTINGVKTSPSVAYGWKQRSSDFIRAFGPLKISGYVVAPSGSSTGSLVVGSGTAFTDGANYSVDPNNPSYIVDSGTTTSKIFRYYQSGSDWVYNTNNGAGYANLDPVYYNPGGLGVLDTVGTSNYSLQRVFWYPNSVTKAITVYYGNDRYGTLALAQAALASEQFSEAPNTLANAVYLGTFAIKGGTNTTLQNPIHFTWIPGGLFRGSSGGSGGGSGGGSTTLAGLSDVSITSVANHNLLAYNSSTTKWENVSTITANVTGTATTASYISPAFISASAAASGFGGGGTTDTGSLLTTASFNSYTSSTTAQFAGTASFATTALNLIGSVTSAATASFATNFTIASTLALDETLIDFAKVTSTIVGSNNLFQQATGSYTAAHGRYTAYKAGNSRAGEFVTSWNGTTVSYYDNATVDIGNTTDITFQSAIVTSQLQINATAASSGWTIKMIVTYL
jgi:hypothetical protein